MANTMYFNEAEFNRRREELRAWKAKTVQSINKVVTEKLSDLVAVDRIPDGAQFGFTSSDQFTVSFTKKHTWIQAERGLYRGVKI